MKTVQWQMKENFVFPKSTGMPTGAETVKVTPRFKVDRSQDSVRLIGIYHLAINVKLNTEMSIESNAESAILIDDVDLKGDTGYFEYAVPFNIDLPPEAHDPLNIVTTNAVSELDGQGAIGIIWDVECSYKEVVVIQKSIPEIKVEPMPKVETEQKVEEIKTETVTETKQKAKADTKPKEKVEKHTETKSEPELVPELEVVPEPVEVQEVIQKSEEVVLEKGAPTATEIKLENQTFNEDDELLSFFTGLDDDLSATLFRSNDIPVQSES